MVKFARTEGDHGVTSDVVNPSDETEQLIWRSYVWSCRLVVCIAGMNPAGMEPSKRAAVSICDQELRALFGARFADLEQRCRSARFVSLVKKAYDLDDGETCLYRSDSGVRRSTVVGQQPGCDVIAHSFLDRMDLMIRSNTCLNAVLTRNVMFSCSSQSGPSNLHTPLKIWRRQTEQQSHENFVDIVNNTEVNDDVPEKYNLTVYVKDDQQKDHQHMLLRQHESSCHVGRS